MNCYFCNQLGYPTSKSSTVFQCLNCQHKFNLYGIYTTYNSGIPYIAHIYVQKKNLIHIRLWLLENETEISEAWDPHKSITFLEGFPITIDNANQKLDTILTFI